MGYTIYYVLQRDTPVSNIEKQTLAEQVHGWSEEGWEMEAYDLILPAEPRPDRIIGRGASKIGYDLDSTDAHQLLSALTELRALLPDAMLWVSDDLQLIRWDEELAEYGVHEPQKQPMPSYEWFDGISVRSLFETRERWSAPTVAPEVGAATTEVVAEETGPSVATRDTECSPVSTLAPEVVSGKPGPVVVSLHDVECFGLRIHQLSVVVDFDKHELRGKLLVAAGDTVKIRSVDCVLRHADGRVVGTTSDRLDHSVRGERKLGWSSHLREGQLTATDRLELGIELDLPIEATLYVADVPRLLGMPPHCVRLVRRDAPVDGAWIDIDASLYVGRKGRLEVFYETTWQLPITDRNLSLDFRLMDGSGTIVRRDDTRLRFERRIGSKAFRRMDSKALERIRTVEIRVKGEGRAQCLLGSLKLPAAPTPPPATRRYRNPAAVRSLRDANSSSEYEIREGGELETDGDIRVDPPNSSGDCAWAGWVTCYAWDGDAFRYMRITVEFRDEDGSKLYRVQHHTPALTADTSSIDLEGVDPIPGTVAAAVARLVPVGVQLLPAKRVDVCFASENRSSTSDVDTSGPVRFRSATLEIEDVERRVKDDSEMSVATLIAEVDNAGDGCEVRFLVHFLNEFGDDVSQARSAELDLIPAGHTRVCHSFRVRRPARVHAAKCWLELHEPGPEHLCYLQVRPFEDDEDQLEDEDDEYF